MLCVYVAGHREAAVEDLLGVVHRSLQQVAEVLVLWQLLVACLTPLRDSLSMVDEYLEEGVHEKDAIRKDTAAVQQHRLWGPVEGVGVENGLYHDERLGQVLTHELVSVV